MINVVKPQNKNIEIFGSKRMPENIASNLKESQDVINNYAKSQKAQIFFSDNEQFELAGQKSFKKGGINIATHTENVSNYGLFYENKTSQKPLLRQIYERVQEMFGDKSPIEKMQVDTLARLRKIGKIK